MTAGAAGLMQIGEVADRSGMSLRTLRHYDDIGLLVPSARSEGGFRLYTGDDLARLMVIRRMKPLGYALEDMQRIMRLLQGEQVQVGQWDAVLTEAAQRRQELVEKLAMADEFLHLVRSTAGRAATTGP